jgi:hypothetical protein
MVKMKIKILWCIYDITYGLFGRARTFPLVHVFPLVHRIILYFIDKNISIKAP